MTWMTPQQIIDADAKTLVNLVWRQFGCNHQFADLSELRKKILEDWSTQVGRPDFMKTETFIRAWQDGGVFAESFDRQWRERVESETHSGDEQKL